MSGSLAGAIACTACCMLSLVLAPSIVWLVIGNRYKDAPCNEIANTPDLATWLIIDGAVGVGNVFFILMAGLGLGCYSQDVKCCGMMTEVTSIIYLFLSSMFLFGWGILEIVRLVDDDACQNENPTLFNTTIAAVIFTFIGMMANGSSGGGMVGAASS